MNLLSPEKDRTALAFLRAAKDLCKSELLRRGDLLESGIVGFPDLDTTGRLATVTKLPDEDALRGLVSRVRKFLLESDPTFFYRSLNIAYPTLKGRHDAGPVLQFLDELRSEWAATNKLREGTPQLVYYTDVPPGPVTSVSPEVALQAWLYAEIFHNSDPKLIARWDEVNSLRGMADIYRAYALSAIVGYIPLVLALAFVLGAIRRGNVPNQTEIARFKSSWQNDWEVKVPPPDHFLGRLIDPPMRQDTARRILRGETVSVDDIERDLASQKLRTNASTEQAKNKDLG